MIGSNGDGVNDAAEANVIANNSASGVVMIGTTTVNKTLRGNFIFSNGGLGIDWGEDGSLETVRNFYRLLGDTNGDRRTDALDYTNISRKNGSLGSNLDEDISIAAVPEPSAWSLVLISLLLLRLRGECLPRQPSSCCQILPS